MGTQPTPTNPQEVYNAAYWASKSPEILEAFSIARKDPMSARGVMLGVALDLHAKGRVGQADLVDFPIMVEMWDPYITNTFIRQQTKPGYTWVPSALQTPIGQVPGIAAPGVAPLNGQVAYDPEKPPTGSILVYTSPDAYKPYGKGA